jgi:hypothetical protein
MKGRPSRPHPPPPPPTPQPPFPNPTNPKTKLTTPPKTETHELTAICWKKCVTNTTTGGSVFGRSSGGGSALDKAEQTCLANCVDRFMDANLATMKHLASMRQQ